MTTKKLYGEYINPTIDPYSSKRENPLVLMAQACNNIGKELSQSSPPLFLSKQRKSNSPREENKSLKRTASITSLSSPPIAKKIPIPSLCQESFYVPPFPFMFDSLFLHHLNKTLPFSYSSNSAFTSSTQQSPYFMDSILSSSSSSPFVCNWMDSDGFCGRRFTNHLNLLEHLCTGHTSIKSSYPSYYSLTNL